MSGQHTPEPWMLSDLGNVVVADGLTVARLIGSNPKRRADADRLVDCVNAMRDIVDPGAFVEDVNRLCDLINSIGADALDSPEMDRVMSALVLR